MNHQSDELSLILANVFHTLRSVQFHKAIWQFCPEGSLILNNVRSVEVDGKNFASNVYKINNKSVHRLILKTVKGDRL